MDSKEKRPADVEAVLDDLVERYLRESPDRRRRIVELVSEAINPAFIYTLAQEQTGYDYFPLENSLNPQEQALLQQDPETGYRVLFTAAGAMALSDLRYSDVSLHNGNGDAYRHAYWNYTMVRKVGGGRAEQWANAHEDGAAGQPQIEREMDLWNNQVGRNIGATGQQSADFVQENVRGGVCRRIVNGNLVPSNSEGEE